MSSVIKHIVKAIRGSAIFNPDVQVAPACILWPDKDHGKPSFHAYKMSWVSYSS